MASLCHTCHHVRRITSGRGQAFYLCQRHLSEKVFPKYPPQPVFACHGYEPNPARTAGREPNDEVAEFLDRDGEQ